MSLLGTKEIADMLGVTQKHVTDRIVTRPDFPAPAVGSSQRTRKWLEADVLGFLRGDPPPRMPRRFSPVAPVAWADAEAMDRFYQEAKRLTQETGVRHHVDHVIPINGELVSGLHVETNLQILTASENSKKSNRFEVEA
jgi:hypothetical protein